MINYKIYFKNLILYNYGVTLLFFPNYISSKNI